MASREKPMDKQTIPWRGWERSTFETARLQNRPIFLYLRTPWGNAVHVFERDVLSHPEVVSAILEHYVPIRLDSMRYPDISERYQQGGWPSFCMLTPTGEILFGKSQVSVSALLSALKGVAETYRKSSDEIARRIDESEPPSLPRLEPAETGEVLQMNSLDAIRRDALAFFDIRHHGFGRAPKFPLSDLLLFLLEDPSPDLRQLTLMTLDTLEKSSLHDLIGGGFHRYCEDEAWSSPNFEKLAYDNFALLEAYIEAFRQTGDDRFAQVGQRILTYLENSLGDPDSGLMYSAQDSDGVPGDKAGFYGWTAEEVRNALDDELKAQALITHLGISPLSRIPGGGERSFLEKRIPVRQVALRLGMEEDEVQEMVDDSLRVLARVRAERTEPGVDGSFYTAVQGRAIGAFAQASILLDRPRYLQRAFEIADRVWQIGRSEQGGIVHILGDEDDTIYLSDQTEMILGTLELYRVAGRAKDLVHAEEVARETFELLGDPEGPGCFDHLERAQEYGAARYPYTPFEANSRLLFASSLLAALTQDPVWHQRSLDMIEGLEKMRGQHRMRDAIYGRALRRMVQIPNMVDLVTGDGVGEMRKRILREAPAGTLIRAFDPDQATPWTPLERYPSNGAQARAIVYAGGHKFDATHDVELALLHLNEQI